MEVQAIALTSFVHGHINAEADRTLTLDEHLALELERHGLVRIRQMERRVDRELRIGAVAEFVPVTPGKVQAVGQATPSSSSPAAPASPRTTLHVSKHGKAKRRAGAR